MLNSFVKPSLHLRNLSIQILVVFIVGFLLGIACIWLSPLWTLVALAGLGFGIAVVKRPEFALLSILAMTSTIIFENTLPLIPIGIGSLHIPDILLLISILLIVLRWLVEPDFKILHTPLDWPLLTFYIFALISTTSAILQSSVSFNLGFREIRIISYYLTFFVVTNLVRDDRQLYLLIRGLLMLATITAVAMLIQFLVRDTVILIPGKVNPLVTENVSYSDVTRILPPGQSIILVAFITITVNLIMTRSKFPSVSSFLQWGLMGLAVLITFTRTSWIQVGLAVLILVYVGGIRARRKLITLGLAAIMVSTIILLPALDQPESRLGRLITASFERATTLTSTKTMKHSTLEWRFIENSYAIDSITSYPLLGVGLGARYRPWDKRIDRIERTWWDATYYIHNGHFWILVKTGLLGYFGLVWLSAVFLFRSFKNWRLIPDPVLKYYVLSFTLIYMGILVGALLFPIFVQWFWTPIIGILFGINEAVFCRGGNLRKRVGMSGQYRRDETKGFTRRLTIS